MSAGRILLIVFGVLIGLLGLSAAGGGGALLWAHATQRDDDGFFTTRSIALSGPGVAVVSDEVDLGTDGGAWAADLGDLAEVRIRATSERPARGLFVGIGREDAVQAYLAGVPHTRVDDVDLDPLRVRSDDRPGSRTPGAPTGQTFWAAQTSGAGTQTLTWTPESGRWTVVMMNADASRGVRADVDLGIKVGFLRGLGIGFLVGGLVLLAIGVVMVVLGVRSRRGPPAQTADGAAPATGQPGG